MVLALAHLVSGAQGGVYVLRCSFLILSAFRENISPQELDDEFLMPGDTEFKVPTYSGSSTSPYARFHCFIEVRRECHDQANPPSSALRKQSHWKSTFA